MPLSLGFSLENIEMINMFELQWGKQKVDCNKEMCWNMLCLYIAYFAPNGLEGDKNVITRFPGSSFWVVFKAKIRSSVIFMKMAFLTLIFCIRVSNNHISMERDTIGVNNPQWVHHSFCLCHASKSFTFSVMPPNIKYWKTIDLVFHSHIVRL